MKILHFQDNASPRQPVIVTIGNFDGMHLGHQFIVRKVVHEAQATQCSSVMVTFEPHPQEVIQPHKAVKKICTPELRNRLLEGMGLDALHVIPFTPQFSQRSAEDFARECLIERFQLKKLIVGYDFHFGKQRRGNAKLLETLSHEEGFALEEVAPIQMGNQIVSSTLIRQLIQENRFDEIPPYLGRPYSLYAPVEQGEQRGRTMGFPTANLKLAIKIPLEVGVYVTHVQVRNQMFHGVTNVGFRPTFEHREQTVETFIFDFSDDIYGEKLEVWPLKQLRKEKKFPNINALKAQIHKDVENAQAFFQSQ